MPVIPPFGENVNINPFATDQVDPQIAKITQEDYLGSFKQGKTAPVTNPTSTNEQGENLFGKLNVISPTANILGDKIYDIVDGQRVSLGTIDDLRAGKITAPKSKVNTIDTSLAMSDVGNLSQQLADRKKELDQQLADERMAIQNEEQQKRDRLLKDQGEETKTAQALQFKLGRADTQYGAGTMEDLKTKQNYEIKQLADEERALIARATKAIQDQRYTEAKQLREEAQQKFDNAMKIKADQRAQEAANIEKLYKTTQEKAANQELYGKQVAEKADLIANNLTEDKTANLKLVQDMAKEYGLDYNDLMSAAIKAKTAMDAKTAPKGDIGQWEAAIKAGAIPAGTTYAQWQAMKATGTVKEWLSAIQSGAIPKNTEYAEYLKIKPTAAAQVKKQFKAPAKGGGGSTSGFNEKKATTSMASEISKVVGSDGYISPDDYTKARTAWIQSGGNATVFDTKFKGYRNPNNPYYVTTKTKK